MKVTSYTLQGGLYLPLTVISAPEKEFKWRVEVALRFNGVGSTMQNVLERKLAVISHVLVGNF